MLKDGGKGWDADCCIPRAIYPAKKKCYISLKPIRSGYRLHQTKGVPLMRQAVYFDTTVCSNKPCGLLRT